MHSARAHEEREEGPGDAPATAMIPPSARNMFRIPDGLVPSARRVPISRVRSVTAIVMTIAADRTITTRNGPDKAEYAV